MNIYRLIRPAIKQNALLVIVSLLPVWLGMAACGDIRPGPQPPPVGDINEQTITTPSSLPPAPDDIPVHFDHISLEDGLSQSTINTILQDSQGFMWFGTTDGLNRFDGYEFTVYKHDSADETTLSHNHILVLFEDSQGNLWVGTDGGGLNLFDRNREDFIHYRSSSTNPDSISSDSVTAIYEDADGNFLIGTSNGLNKLNREDGTFTHHPNDVTPFGDNPNNDHITAILQDQQGTIWLGTMAGMLTFNPQDQSYTDFPLIRPLPPRIPEGPEEVKVLSIFEDNSGLLWIGTQGEGLISIDLSTRRLNHNLHDRNSQHSLRHNTVNHITQDRLDSLWIGTGGGLDRLAPGNDRFEHFRAFPNDGEGLSDDEIRVVFFDAAGVLWIGTTIGGIDKYDPFKTKFAHIRSNTADPNELSDPQVWTFFQDNLDYLWIGTSSGLDKLDRRTGQMTHYLHDPEDSRSLSDNHISKIINDRYGNLWFATSYGLNRFDRSANSFYRFLPDPDDPSSLSNPEIIALHEDKLGYIWVGTAGSGLDRLDRVANQFDHFQYSEEAQLQESLPLNNICYFFEDGNNSMWVGTMGGLARFDQETETFTYFHHDPIDPDSLSDNIVNAIHRDSEGTVWIGTAHGLDWLNESDNSFGHYREKDGLANNTVLGILEDSDGHLWLSTNRGLSRFDPKTGAFRNYDTSDGLQSLEFNAGAFYQNDESEMFFGGINGFNSFYPEEVRDNTYSPPIVITDFLLGNESVPIGPNSLLQQSIIQTKDIRMPGQGKAFSFEFSALHYGAPQEIQYAYIMEGFDTDWNYIGGRRFATYTNLPPGDYIFRATGTNSDGVWSEKSTAVNINVPYPFWQTWWFATLLVLAVVGTAVAAYRLRTRNIEARTRELEELVAVRTTEIQARREIAEGLREILILLNSNRSLEESLHYIVSQAARLTDAEDAIIFRHDPDESMMIMATNPGGRIRYSPDAAIIGVTENWANDGLLDNQPLVIPDFIVYWLAHPEIRSESQENYHALLGIPLHLGKEIYGGLLMFYDQVRNFSDEDLELGFTFADQAALAIANDRLREQAEQTAVAMERSRLARELHDAVTQTIFSASLIAETVPPVWEMDQEEGRKLLQELRQLTRGALAEMRTLLLELRPAALEETRLADLLKQLSEAVTGRTGVPVRIQVKDTCELPVNVKVALYRIAQESLNNVMKHARASHVEVSLSGYSHENGVLLSVKDDGRGFDLNNVPADRLGLKIIRERAQAISASLSIETHPDRGTQILVEWHEGQ